MYKERNKNMNKYKKLIIYVAEWFIPSATLLYIIFHEYLFWGRVPSYLVANFICMILFYPINRYIFNK